MAHSSEGPYVHRLQVRYGETDQMGRVHHANFLLYIEEARTRLLADAGMPYSRVEREGLGLVVRDVEIRYRAAALYEDELAVHTRVTDLRSASVEIGYELHRPSDRTHIASATTRLACVDLRAEPPRICVIPASLKAAFASSLASGAS